MKLNHLLWFSYFFIQLILLTVLSTTTFAQDASNCTVISKDSNVIIYSCPDGTRTVDVGSRAGFYRVGDRVDIYGMPSNRPESDPGKTTFPGR